MLITLLLAGCHRATIPEGPPPDRRGAVQTAASTVGEAASAGLEYTNEVLAAQIDERIARVNQSSERIVGLVQAVRFAIPSTRLSSPEGLDEVDARYRVVDERLGELNEDPLWSGVYHRAYLDEAAELLAIVARFRRALLKERFDEADLLYDDIFVQYESWRGAAAGLAEATAADPVSTWTIAPAAGT